MYLGDSWFVNRTVNQGKRQNFIIMSQSKTYNTKHTIDKQTLFYTSQYLYDIFSRTSELSCNFLCSRKPQVCFTGIEIAERRREKIKKELEEYQLCLDNIENKLDMTSELEEGIVEELTEEDIKRS